MGAIAIEDCTSVPPRDAMDQVLRQYYDLIVRRMTEMGFEIDPAAPTSALAEFWAHADDYLPPRAALFWREMAAGKSSAAACSNGSMPTRAS